ncbi:hypothetical protein ACFL4T_11750 [candidate division KSB1 bacterium]
MHLVTGENILKFVSNLISEKKQLYHDRINLTVKSIYEVHTKGQIDFGGSEFNLGSRKELIPVKDKPEDQYGWWDIPQGDYLVIFNEKIDLSEHYIGFLQPMERIIINGTTHESMFILSNLDKVEVNLRAGKSGLKIKQNSRISSLIIFKVS